MNDLGFRCEGDENLQTKLLEERVVQSACEKIEELPERSVRRQLLATSLRLTKSMSPKLHGLLQSCAETLKLSIPLEAFVYNSPQFNAACIKPEQGTLLLMFSSSILEKFSEQELLFVMGHELGHHLFRHHDIPIGYLAKGSKKVNAQLALQLFSWSRYAEISADRAGALCTSDANSAARALFKLASGLTTDLIEINIEDFAAQADEMDLEQPQGKQTDSSSDWFMTHPFTPLRVKALQSFFESKLCKSDGSSREKLEAQCHDLMGMMSPNYLNEKSEIAETMRRVLFAAGLGLIRCSGGVKDEEMAAFDSLFGAGSYSENLDFDGLESLLEKRIGDANATVPHSRKTQVLRDLCLLAICDGRVTAPERQYIHQIGKKLKVSQAVIESCFERDPQLD
jgi:hypothetical protein